VAAAAKPAASAAAAPAATTAPAAAASAYQTLLDAAKKEDKLALWIATPNIESTQRAVIDAFKQRFGLSNLQVDWVAIPQRDAATRVVSESKAGVTTVDVVSGGSTTSKPVLDADLITSFDWVGTFGSTFPGLKEAAERPIDIYRGKTVAHWDIVYVVGFNTDQIKAADVPDDIEQLTTPKWQGKFAMNSQPGSPYDLLALKLGSDGVADLVRRLLANKPVLRNGSPAVLSSLVSGEVPVAFSYASGIEAQKKIGAPVDWKAFGQYTPVLPLDLYVPKGAQHPNVARLFIAWLATEGMPLQEEREFIGRASDPKSSTAAKLVSGAQLLTPTTSEQQKVIEEAGAKMAPVFGAVGG
jgi:iron(III) transport system substrate-binding protein